MDYGTNKPNHLDWVVVSSLVRTQKITADHVGWYMRPTMYILLLVELEFYDGLAEALHGQAYIGCALLLGGSICTPCILYAEQLTSKT